MGDRGIALALALAVVGPGAARGADGSSGPAAETPEDFPDFLGRVTGLWGNPDRPPGTKPPPRFNWAATPFVVTSPLLDVGAGVAGVGTFRLGDGETRLSKFSTNVLVTVNRQIAIPLRTSIDLPGSDWKLVGTLSWRKFPSPTWGIGGDTPDSARTIVDYSLFRFYEVAYRRIFENIYGGIGYHLDCFYNVSGATPAGAPAAYSVTGDAPLAGSVSSGVSLNLLYDSRDSPVNATRGWFASASVKHSPTWLGSDQKWTSLFLDLRTYLELPRPDVLALWAFGWVASSNTPYLLLPANGSDPDVRSSRGYIEGRHVGHALLYAEAEYRFHIWKFLGGIAGLNVHSVAEPDETGPGRFRTWWPAAVAGVRLLVNGPSRANAVLDVAAGLDGSRGVYLNFNETF